METARWSYLNIQSFRPLCVTARKTKHAFCERLPAFLLVYFLFDHILYLWNNNVIIHDKSNLHVHYIIFFIWHWKLYLSTIHNIYMYLHVHFLLFWRVHYSSIPHYAGKKTQQIKVNWWIQVMTLYLQLFIFSTELNIQSCLPRSRKRNLHCPVRDSWHLDTPTSLG